MSFEFTVKFDESHIKYAVRNFFMRYLGIGLPIAFLILAVVVAQRLFARQFDWLFGALLVVLVMGVGVFAALYFKRLGYALGQFRKMGDGTVHYELTDYSLRASSVIGSTELKWTVFRGLWIFPKVWLLMFDEAGYLTLPCDQLTEEVRDYLKKRIAAVGGKLKQ